MSVFIDTQSGIVKLNGLNAQIKKFVGYGVNNKGKRDRIWSLLVEKSRATSTHWESNIDFLGQDPERLVLKYENSH